LWILAKVEDASAEAVLEGFIRRLRSLPKAFRQTLTFRTIRSYLENLRKQGIDLLHALVESLIRGKPLSPPWDNLPRVNRCGESCSDCVVTTATPRPSRS
jgi:hypothetical protein